MSTSGQANLRRRGVRHRTHGLLPLVNGLTKDTHRDDAADEARQLKADSGALKRTLAAAVNSACEGAFRNTKPERKKKLPPLPEETGVCLLHGGNGPGADFDRGQRWRERRDGHLRLDAVAS